MFDWTERYGWVLMFLAVLMVVCQLIRFAVNSFMGG